MAKRLFCLTLVIVLLFAFSVNAFALSNVDTYILPGTPFSVGQTVWIFDMTTRIVAPQVYSYLGATPQIAIPWLVGLILSENPELVNELGVHLVNGSIRFVDQVKILGAWAKDHHFNDISVVGPALVFLPLVWLSSVQDLIKSGNDRGDFGSSSDTPNDAFSTLFPDLGSADLSSDSFPALVYKDFALVPALVGPNDPSDFGSLYTAWGLSTLGKNKEFVVGSDVYPVDVVTGNNTIGPFYELVLKVSDNFDGVLYFYDDMPGSNFFDGLHIVHGDMAWTYNLVNDYDATAHYIGTTIDNRTVYGINMADTNHEIRLLLSRGSGEYSDYIPSGSRVDFFINNKFTSSIAGLQFQQNQVVVDEWLPINNEPFIGLPFDNVDLPVFSDDVVVPVSGSSSVTLPEIIDDYAANVQRELLSEGVSTAIGEVDVPVTSDLDYSSDLNFIQRIIQAILNVLNDIKALLHDIWVGLKGFIASIGQFFANLPRLSTIWHYVVDMVNEALPGIAFFFLWLNSMPALFSILLYGVISLIIILGLLGRLFD